MLARDIDEVIELLEHRIQTYVRQNSPLAYFAALYRAVTVRVRAGIAHGAFDDGARMNRFDTNFANRYFAALAELDAGRPPARAWRVAFSAEARPGTTILQHALLGVNAHINFDLPFAAVETAPGDALPSLWRDYETINAILARALDEVQAIIGRFSPLMHILDQVGGRSDERLATFSVVVARDEAWHEATRLAFEGGSTERATRSLDRRTALVGEHLVLPGGPLGLALQLVAATESQDVAAVTDALFALG